MAVGRDLDRTQDVVSHVPGVDTVDHEVVDAAHDVASLTEALRRRVRRLQHGRAVHQLRARGGRGVHSPPGCHYLDTTGEQDWVLAAQERSARVVRGEAGLLLSPGRRADVHHGRDRGEHRLETPGPGHARHPRALEGLPDVRVDADDLHDPQGGLVLPRRRTSTSRGTHRRRASASCPASTARRSTVPWGGTSHPVWFKNDPRVANGHRRSAASSTVPSWTAWSRRRRWSRRRSGRCAPDEQEAQLARDRRVAAVGDAAA